MNTSRSLRFSGGMASHTATSDQENTGYEYNTFDGHPKDTIRILTVQPGHFESITCHVSDVKLSENPSYNALSYMWGHEKRTKSISINGRAFLVRPNLWAFLNRLRSDTPSPIWIDAICVNQADLMERASQVRLMGRIYGQAIRVIVWLELEFDHQGLNEDVIEILCLDDAAFRTKIFISQRHQALASRGREIIAQVCLDSYWERAWIVQEVLLAQDVVVWCGIAGEINLITFNRIYCLLIRFDEAWNQVASYQSQPAFRYNTNISRLLRFKYRDKIVEMSGNSLTLRDLLEYSLETRCSDPRDRVFAFLSLANDTEKYGIVPDYRKPPSELFFDLLIRRYKAVFDNTTIGLGQGPDAVKLNATAEIMRIALGCTYTDLLTSSQFLCVGSARHGGSNPCIGTGLAKTLRRHEEDSDFIGSEKAFFQVFLGPRYDPMALGPRIQSGEIFNDVIVYSLALFLICLVYQAQSGRLRRLQTFVTSMSAHQSLPNLYMDLVSRYTLDPRVWTQRDLKDKREYTWNEITKFYLPTSNEVLTIYMGQERVARGSVKGGSMLEVD